MRYSSSSAATGKAARYVLRYLKYARNFSIVYLKQNAQILRLFGFSDANWGGDKNESKQGTYSSMSPNDPHSFDLSLRTFEHHETHTPLGAGRGEPRIPIR